MKENMLSRIDPRLHCHLVLGARRRGEGGLTEHELTNRLAGGHKGSGPFRNQHSPMEGR